MAILDELYSASFRGVPFKFHASSTTGGRKQVVHEYPNSNRRYVEDLGALATTFKITAIVDEPEYLIKRDAFIAAITEEGAGLLRHPFYGDHYVTVDPYTVSEKDDSLGWAEFDLTFRKTSDSLFPASVQRSIDAINDLTDGALSKIVTEISNYYDISRIYPNNLISGSNNSDVILNIFKKINSSASTDEESKNEFNAQIKDFESNKFNYLKAPDVLGQKFIDLHSKSNEIQSSESQKLSVNNNFFNFEFSEIPIVPFTIQRKERQRNSNLLVSMVNMASLVLSYQSAAKVDYSTITELDNISGILEKQYEYYIGKSIFDSDTGLALTDLRNEVRKYFDAERLLVYKITAITTQMRPLTTLVYDYYGSVDNTESIMNLNDINDPAHVEGSINILTGGQQ